MPTFSNHLPPKMERRGFDLKRTPPDRPMKGLITSDDIIGCNTHWWGGRTVPCEEEGCEACKNNTPSRWHCYLSLYEQGTKDHFIFECTGKAALPLVEWKQTYGTLRGVHMVATRPKRRRNARVDIILRPFDITNIMLPKPPDLAAAMCVIWQIPQAAAKTNSAVRGAALITTDNEILDAQRYNEADGLDPKRNGKKATKCHA